MQFGFDIRVVSRCKRTCCAAAVLLALIVATGLTAWAGSLVDMSGIPASEFKLFAVKDDAPLIMVDMAYELDHYEPLGEDARQEYFAKRALGVVLEDGLAKPRFEGLDPFEVKLVVVEEYDNYDQPQWFSAPVLARYRVSRASLDGLTFEAVNQMGMDQLSKLAVQQ